MKIANFFFFFFLLFSNFYSFAENNNFTEWKQNFKIYDMGGLFDRLELLEDENLEMFAKTPNATNLLCMHNETDIKNYQH